jgi:hypothetical protein
MELSDYEAVIADLPKQAQDRLRNCPRPGQGVNPWIFTTALSLTNYFDDDFIIEILEAFVTCPEREREILRAVARAREIANGEEGGSSKLRALWPAVDYTMVDKTVIDCPVRLKDLRSLSPVSVGGDNPMTEEIVDVLFPGNPLLCFGESPWAFWTRPRESWRGSESDFQFIVPSPMIKETGVGKDGKESKRCLANTGPRRFLVTEFDISEKDEDWGPYVRDWQAKGISVLDANVALLLELARRGLPRLPLALAVYSGGKSIHGWFPCAGLTDEQLRPFMDRAVRLGADRATWTRCQLVRMPDGTRSDGKRQQVHFFAPQVIARKEVHSGSSTR